MRRGGDALGFGTREIERGARMVIRPVHLNAYEFVVVSALRTQQLLAGSVPRIVGQHSAATMAQMEVAGGHVMRANGTTVVAPRQCRWQL